MNIVYRDLPRVGSADEIYTTTLERILGEGAVLEGGESRSIGSGKESKEILNFCMTLTAPRERLLRIPGKRLNLPAAVARFVWMMAGSDRLADIAFYEPKVIPFSDDGISVPGSNYGERILQPRPGLNQLRAVIDRLKEDESSRRAAVAVYHPEDAVRDSNDIPCTFGILYHVRGGELHATTLMRSNNAFTLLPYNIFEFSLLAEVVSAEVNVALGSLTHFAASMHVYADHYNASSGVIEAAKAADDIGLPSMPEMPRDGALEQVRQLVILEAALRHGSAGVSGESIEEWISRGENKLNDYWRQLYFLLLLHVAKKNSSAGALQSLRTAIKAPFIGYLRDDAFSTGTEVEYEQERFDLELGGPSASNVVPLHKTKAYAALKVRVQEWEEGGEKLPWQAFAKLEEHFNGQIAARGDFNVIPKDDFERVLAAALKTE